MARCRCGSGPKGRQQTSPGQATIGSAALGGDHQDLGALKGRDNRCFAPSGLGDMDSNQPRAALPMVACPGLVCARPFGPEPQKWNLVFGELGWLHPFQNCSADKVNATGVVNSRTFFESGCRLGIRPDRSGWNPNTFFFMSYFSVPYLFVSSVAQSSLSTHPAAKESETGLTERYGTEK